MRRGIFRTIAGGIMILLQLLSMMVLSSAGIDYTSSDIWYNIGFYSTGIVGILLLIFGIKALKKGLHSQLILHTKTGKLHTVFKWVMLVITLLVCVAFSAAFIQNFDNFNIYTLLMIFATLSFAVYLLFYIYKKPSCLPSACLIFMGVAYLYGILSNMTYYLIYASEYDFWTMMLIFGIIPQLIAGILYIILATKLYKEKFSVNAVKVIGWITFALEISIIIIYPNLLSGGNLKYDISGLLYLLYKFGLILYISVFKINSLSKNVVNETKEDVVPKENAECNLPNLKNATCKTTPNVVIQENKNISQNPFTVFANISSIVLSVLSIAIILFVLIVEVQNYYFIGLRYYQFVVCYSILLIEFGAFLVFAIVSLKNRHFKLSAGLSIVLLLIAGVVFSILDLEYYSRYSGTNIVCVSSIITFIIAILIFLVMLLPVGFAIKTGWYKSVTYRENCYKRIAKMHSYLEKGIITQEEYETAKELILKNIK